MPDGQQATQLRIHGDNIIECERALSLIADSLPAVMRPVSSSPYVPRYEIEREGRVLFIVDLFAGHGRWNMNLQEILQSHGAPLREAVDAIVTRLSPDGEQEEAIMAFEFCSALPAGNNAWQRNGRALTCAAVGIPYLYFAEVGGVELGASRRIKAPRFPNPVIPYSYLSASVLFHVICLPIYLPSPSSSEPIRNQFAPAFGMEDARLLIRCLLEGVSSDIPAERLICKGLVLTEMLAAQRRSVDTLRGKQWTELLRCETVGQKSTWLEQNPMPWCRKMGSKVAVTETLRSLLRLFRDIGCLSVGANDIPLCLIPGQARQRLAHVFSSLYGDKLPAEFDEWLSSSLSPLIVIWITGFKPRGDDSRPDRGLAPLARMLFGDDAHILSIVYGPAKPMMWKALLESPQQLARQNGLWEAIVNLSNAVWVDSATAVNGPYALLLPREALCFRGRVILPAASATGVFSEQDVDSILHLLFARQEHRGVFEAMCNPPGGDWSGVSMLNFQTGEEYRWTSLPRVSDAGGKRPDHVVQFRLEDGDTTLLAIESKERASALDHEVGHRLLTYTRQLVEKPPTISRGAGTEWQLWLSGSRPSIPGITVISGGAFCWSGEGEMERSLTRCGIDVAFAVEFRSIEQAVLLHVKVGAAAGFLLPKLHELIQQFGGRLEIQIH